MTSSDKLRQELLTALGQLSKLRPEWRLGQTMANVAMSAGRLDSGGVWELEDSEALAAVKALIEQYSSTDSLKPQTSTVPGAQAPTAS